VNDIPYLLTKDQLKAYEIRQWIGQNASELKKITELNLDYANLNELPPELGALAEIQKLSAINKYFHFLPSTIGNWQKIKELDLFGNQLKTLPSEVGNWVEIEQLSLYHNQISSLPNRAGIIDYLATTKKIEKETKFF
jgi:Leucine-rich repeat (LRR) protein